MSTAVSSSASTTALMQERRNELIVVAMSGGVDSSAAAVMLHEQGYSVLGVSMQVWDYRKNGGNERRATCCAPADFDDAREVAEAYGFPFYVFDFEDSFYESVISPFVSSYLQGATPNPCLDCNRKVKFAQLRERAAALGATRVATGHYAQIKPLSDGKQGLFTSVDQAKDQSYFLYAMTQEDLQRTLFPVGALKKPVIRAFLENRGVRTAMKAESQDICFVSGSVADFVNKESAGESRKGKIVDVEGKVLGEHEGIHGFTVGQRKGLGLSSPHPLYVINIDADSSEVRVGAKENLATEGFQIRDVNWIAGRAPESEQEVLIKMRYRHAGVLCRLQAEADGVARAKFISDWSTVSPGQAAVFYSTELDENGDRQVLGGGIISKAQVNG